MQDDETPEDGLARERRAILEEVAAWLDGPMLLLSLAWLGLVVLELIGASNPTIRTTGVVIWILFILDFALRMALAPNRRAYLRKHWLTALGLVAPALRLLPVIPSIVNLLGAVRLTDGMQLAAMLGSLNHGMRAVRAALERRAIHYMIVSTVIVTLVGAAGMYAFEEAVLGAAGPPTYGEALWWTVGLIWSFGAQYAPKTVEGRALASLLGLYGLAASGYLTAALAAYFLGHDAETKENKASEAKSLEGLRAEIAALHADVRLLTRTSGPGGGPERSSG